MQDSKADDKTIVTRCFCLSQSVESQLMVLYNPPRHLIYVRLQMAARCSKAGQRYLPLGYSNIQIVSYLFKQPMSEMLI